MKRKLLQGQQTRFIGLVYRYMSDHDCTQLHVATITGTRPEHLNKILTKAITLSEHYAERCVNARIFTVDELFETDKRTISPQERKSMERLRIIEDKPLMAELCKARGLGVDVLSLLKNATAQARKVIRSTTIKLENGSNLQLKDYGGEPYEGRRDLG